MLAVLRVRSFGSGFVFACRDCGRCVVSERPPQCRHPRTPIRCSDGYPHDVCCSISFWSSRRKKGKILQSADECTSSLCRSTLTEIPNDLNKNVFALVRILRFLYSHVGPGRSKPLVVHNTASPSSHLSPLIGSLVDRVPFCTTAETQLSTSMEAL